MASSSPTSTLSGKAYPPLVRVRIVALGHLCERNQKPALASAERTRLEFSSRGAARAASLLRITRSSCNETYKYWQPRPVPGGGVRV